MAAPGERDGDHDAARARRYERGKDLLFAGADLFVLPSLFEGTPLTLVEAMASGLPIVTTAVCGMKDLIESGRNGLLVPIRSPQAIVGAVRDLIEAPDLRRQIGLSAQRDALTRYTWDRAAEVVADVYGRLLGRRTPPPLVAAAR